MMNTGVFQTRVINPPLIQDAARRSVPGSAGAK
jgi:hypothetical protein